MRPTLVLCALLLGETAALAALPPTHRDAASYVQRTIAELRCDDRGAPSSPWTRVFISVEPVTSLRRVVCPVIAGSGERHLRVPAEYATLLKAVVPSLLGNRASWIAR